MEPQKGQRIAKEEKMRAYKSSPGNAEKRRGVGMLKKSMALLFVAALLVAIALPLHGSAGTAQADGILIVTVECHLPDGSVVSPYPPPILAGGAPGGNPGIVLNVQICLDLGGTPVLLVDPL